jgi:hypothetical protein
LLFTVIYTLHFLQYNKVFQDLRNVENNCFQLAADLDMKVKKNEIHPDDQIVTLARKFTRNCDYYEIIKQVQNNPAMLKNGTIRKQIIVIAQECSAAAYKLASYRKETRQTNNSQLIVSENMTFFVI